MEHISRELEKAANLVPVKHESSVQRIGEEQRFVIAANEPKIIASPLDPLKEVLRLVMVKIGLRAENWPSDAEKAVLLAHIMQHYGTLTHAEILLAFDMAIEGKLTVEANCYENFSCMYFSRIMNAYRKWAAETLKQVPEEIPVESKTLSESMYEDWYNAVESDVTNKRITVEFVPLAIYDWMDKHGRIDQTPAEKRHYIERAVTWREGRLTEQAQDDPQMRSQLTAFVKMREAGAIEGDEIERVINLAKKLIVWDYIKTSSL